MSVKIVLKTSPMQTHVNAKRERFARKIGSITTLENHIQGVPFMLGSHTQISHNIHTELDPFIFNSDGFP